MTDGTTTAPSTAHAPSLVRSVGREFTIIALCFFLSGYAALLYETVWLRQFAILLGTSEQALAVVLASYMGGLAIGAMVAGKIVSKIKRPLLVYGVLEFGIAISALLVPVGLSIAESIQIALFSDSDALPAAGGVAQMTFCFATAFGLIAVPTGLMGATLPLLAKHVVREDELLGRQIGMLYAINTFGAVAGTMSAAFFCLPAFGLGKTVWIGAALNLVVFGLVVWLVKSGTTEPIDVPGEKEVTSDPVETMRPKRKREKGISKSRANIAKDSPAHSPKETEPKYHWILAIAAISGGVSFCFEILFTRMLGHLLGGSVYAFATMLAGFLSGIALGGAIASRFAGTRPNAVNGYIIAQSLAAASVLIAFHLIDSLVGWSWSDFGGTSSTSAQVLASILVLLPTATCIGATFPFAIRIYVPNEKLAASGSAKVYFWNVAGGIVGSVLTGAIILPLLQYHGTAFLAAGIQILLAVSVLLIMKAPPINLGAIALATVFVAILTPKPPENIIRVSAIDGARTPGEILYHHAGRSATVTTYADGGQIHFCTNGLPEAVVLSSGSGTQFLSSGHWLAALPPMLHPECDSMLIIGLGGGVAASAVPPSVKEVDVLELEPAVVEANRAVAMMRDSDPLSDPRVNIVINDGRNALALTEKKYDAIVSQPSHPWTSGASHLYTQEFAELSRARLKSDGIFLQWMLAEFVNEELFRSMAATLRKVFPHVRLYQPHLGVLLFIASDSPVRPEAISATGNENIVANFAEQDRQFFRKMGVVSPVHLLSMLTLDEKGIEAIAEGAAVITDERNLLAMRAPRLLSRSRDAKQSDMDQIEQLWAKYSPASMGIPYLREICPSLNILGYGRQLLKRQYDHCLRGEFLPHLEPSEARSILAAEIAFSKSDDKWIRLLKAAAKEYSSGDAAFLLLRRAAFGQVKLSNSETSTLRGHLDPRHTKVLDLASAIQQDDFDVLRQSDGLLANIPVDDLAYELAVGLRVPWRLESPPALRARYAYEAIQIIDEAPMFTNYIGLSFLRLSAAIKAGRPFTALATLTDLTKAVESSLAGGQPVSPSRIQVLMQCIQVASDPTPFASLDPSHYQQTLFKAQAALETAMMRQSLTR